MTFFTAIKKLSKIKSEKNCYNSDYILNAKEKQSLAAGAILTLFPIFIAMIIIFIN